MRRAGSGVRTNDVVIEHPANCVALLLHPLEHSRAAEQALLFAGNGGKKQRGAKRSVAVGSRAAQQARAFHADRHARSVVIRARRVQIRIHDVGGAAIEMSGDNKNGFREHRIGARKNGVDIFHGNGLLLVLLARSLEICRRRFAACFRILWSISRRRARMWSRAQPGPREESLHEASELRVPQATSCSISARIASGSISFASTALAGRAKKFRFRMHLAEARPDRFARKATPQSTKAAASRTEVMWKCSTDITCTAAMDLDPPAVGDLVAQALLPVRFLPMSNRIETSLVDLRNPHRQECLCYSKL